MNRTQQRKTAFEIIFTIPFNSDVSANELMTNYILHEDGIVLSEYIMNTVKGVCENIEKIDLLIKANIKHRRMERLDNVCLAVMRLGVYEMLFNDEIPVTVAINEAIELFKQYDDSLAPFVHANLGIIAKGENE